MTADLGIDTLPLSPAPSAAPDICSRMFWMGAHALDSIDTFESYTNTCLQKEQGETPKWKER